MRELTPWLERRRVGLARRGRGLGALVYDETWASAPDAHAPSPHLPLGAAPMVDTPDERAVRARLPG
jgi:hypothetical protein